MTDMDNYNKNILITGGASGIGKAIATKFAEEGYRSIITDRHEPEEEENNFHFKKADVRKKEEVRELGEWIKERFGFPGTVIVNAGRGIREKLTEGDPAKWQEIIDTNLMGALHFIRVFAPEMIERKKGNIVFISSVSAGQPHPYGGIYAASKTALEVIAETLRLEALPFIRVTVISPGITDTNFFSDCIGGHRSVEEMGMGTISPEEIAEDVFYCINKKASTGINKIITRPIKQSF